MSKHVVDEVLDSKDQEIVTLRAEAVRLREALEEVWKDASPHDVAWVVMSRRTYNVVLDALYDTPATAKEVERVRAMERVVEAAMQYPTPWIALKDALAYWLEEEGS
jgi:L-asparaginase II